MTLRKRGQHQFGDGPGDVRAELIRYSMQHSGAVTHFADAVCPCSCRVFFLDLDPGAGLAVLECQSCGVNSLIFDRPMTQARAEKYAKDLQLCQCPPPCNNGAFEVVGSVNTKVVKDGVNEEEIARWFFMGLRCVECGMVSCWGDWRADCPITQILGHGPESLARPFSRSQKSAKEQTKPGASKSRKPPGGLADPSAAPDRPRE